VADDRGIEDRLAIAKTICDSPPRVHPNAPNGAVWRTGWRCYEFIASQISPGDRTLETGTGVSTVMFTAWGCEHLSIVPSEFQANVIIAYCHEMDIATENLRFDLRPSETALPGLVGGPEFDLVFIDGAHGFPLPVIDWYYGAGLLRRGGVVVFDDVKLPAVRQLLESYLDRDDRWQMIGGTAVWRAYRRLSEGPLDSDELLQPFFQIGQTGGLGPIRRLLADVVPPALRERLRRS
jgi:hypothetical protein